MATAQYDNRSRIVTNVRQRRHRFTNGQKLGLLRELDQSDETIADFCRRKGRIFTPRQIWSWRQNKDKLKSKGFSKKKSVGTGRQSSLVAIEPQLLRWIKEKQGKGDVVSTKMIDDRVQVDLDGFGAKRYATRHQAIMRWLKAKGLKTMRGKLKP